MQQPQQRCTAFVTFCRSSKRGKLLRNSPIATKAQPAQHAIACRPHRDNTGEAESVWERADVVSDGDRALAPHGIAVPQEEAQRVGTSDLSFSCGLCPPYSTSALRGSPQR